MSNTCVVSEHMANCADLPLIEDFYTLCSWIYNYGYVYGSVFVFSLAKSRLGDKI